MRAYKLKKCKRVHGLHFTPDGKRLLAVGGAEVRMVDCAVWLDLATGENVGRIDQFAQCYAVDPALTRYVLGGADQWESGVARMQWAALSEGSTWHPLPDRSNESATLFPELFGIAIDPTNTRLVVSRGLQFRRDAELGINDWEMQLAALSFDPPGVVAEWRVNNAAGAFAFSHDATRLAVAGGPEGEPEVLVCEWSSGRFLYRFQPPGTRSRQLLYLPDGRLVVANARNVHILPVDGSEPAFTLSGHKGQVNAVTLTPDGTRMLTASHDGMIRAWDANTGEAGPAFDWQIGAITALAFAPDGLTCAAGGEKGQVVVWDVDG